MQELIGDRMARRMESINIEERQRVWDAMRVAAAQRYVAGEMPDWFDPAWLYVGEAPVNTPPGNEWSSEAALGGGSGGGGSGGWTGGGGGWSEDDPYGPLRQTGNHPMRWWTFAFAAVTAAGGLMGALLAGSSEPLQLGWGVAAVLLLGGAAMSDTTSLPGALGVKMCFAACALLAAKEAAWGWQHKRSRKPDSTAPGLGLCGLAAVAMCLGYLLTDMSACGEVALPANPGIVFKSPDVAYRSQVWQQWGYGQVQMRV